LDPYRIWFWFSSLVLAALLFRPVKKFIFVQRVRKAERRLKREMTEEERRDLEQRTVPMTAFIVITFSLLFNSVIMGRYFFK
jgi:dolichol kinase